MVASSVEEELEQLAALVDEAEALGIDPWPERVTPPPGNAQQPGNALIVSDLRPKRTSTPSTPSRVRVKVTVGRGVFLANTGRLTPSGTSLMFHPVGGLLQAFVASLVASNECSSKECKHSNKSSESWSIVYWILVTVSISRDGVQTNSIPFSCSFTNVNHVANRNCS